MEIKLNYKFGGKYDVIVCGGGPSGFAAAVSSARSGRKTLLIEQGGCLGGFWTRGLLTWLIDTYDKGAFLDEIMDRLEKNAEGCDHHQRRDLCCRHSITGNVPAKNH